MRSYEVQMLEKAAFQILLVNLDLSQSRSKTTSLPRRDIFGVRA